MRFFARSASLSLAGSHRHFSWASFMCRLLARFACPVHFPPIYINIYVLRSYFRHLFVVLLCFFFFSSSFISHLFTPLVVLSLNSYWFIAHDRREETTCTRLDERMIARTKDHAAEMSYQHDMSVLARIHCLPCILAGWVCVCEFKHTAHIPEAIPCTSQKPTKGRAKANKNQTERVSTILSIGLISKS